MARPKQAAHTIEDDGSEHKIKTMLNVYNGPASKDYGKAVYKHEAAIKEALK